MDRNLWHCQGEEGVWLKNLRVASLLFTNVVVVLASSSRDLQHTLERFAAECKEAEM